MTGPATVCPSCGGAAAGNFCSGCGASLGVRSCTACGVRLSPQARFCHRCGHPVSAGGEAGLPAERRERTAWLVAAALCLLLLGAIVFKVMGGISAPVAPDMANPGAGAPVAAAGGAAPDISRMSPRERFDRLYNRIMQAADQGDTAQVARFLPMALAAYAQLDSADADARYHAAVLHLQAGDAAAALALADTILRQAPGHLFGYLVRGAAAQLQGDSAGLTRARRDFLSHYGEEMNTKRVEYLEHQPALEEFRTAGKRERGAGKESGEK